MSLTMKLNVEELGARVLPSQAIVLPLPATTPAAVRPSHYALEGIGVGKATTTSTARAITADMNTADLGRVTVSGTIAIGTANQKTTGTLTFTNARGSVTIRLVGLTPNSATNESPKYYRYEIVSGTGDHAHWRQSGTARIDIVNGNVRIAI